MNETAKNGISRKLEIQKKNKDSIYELLQKISVLGSDFEAVE